MGFLDDAKEKLGELGDKAGDAFEAAKDKAGDLIEAGKDKLDHDNDDDIDTADASEAFEDIKFTVSGDGDSPAESVAHPASEVGQAAGDAAAPAGVPVDDAAASAGDAVGDTAVGSEAAEDAALADVQVKAAELTSDDA